MTNERACANQDARPPEPVAEWDDYRVNGYALCDGIYVREHIERIQHLRARQADYLDSLPSDPNEAINAAMKLMHPDGEQYPDGIEEALHLSQALRAMLKDGDIDHQGPDRDAALYVTNRVSFAMCRAVRQLDQMSYVLRNPSRVRGSDVN